MAPSEGFFIERAGEILLAAPDGNISGLAVPDLLREQSRLIDAVRDPAVRAVIIDLESCEHIGSFLLETLHLAWKHVLERRATMVLCNVPESDQEILSGAEFDPPWPAYPSREHAIEALRPSHAAEALEEDDTRIPQLFEEPLRRIDFLEVGPQILVTFGGSNLPPEHALGRYLGEIHALIDRGDCREFSFDMTGVTIVPSGFLGLMASIRKKGVKISLRNPSPEVREVLALTSYDEFVKSS